MPLVRIALREGKPADYRRAIADEVHRALVEVASVPELDRFQILTEHAAGDLIYDPNYLGVKRSDDIVMIQITLNEGRTVEQKKALFKTIVDGLAEKPGIRPEDVLINLIDVRKENWSFGNGVAQYAP